MMLAAILIFIPLIFAIITFFSGKKIAPYIALLSSIISLFYFLVLMSAYDIVGKQLSFNSYIEWIIPLRAYLHFGLDAAAVLPLFLTQLIICLSVLATLVKGNDRDASYYGLIGLAHAGFNGFFSAQNPISFYIFFEAALIPIYFIVLRYGGIDRKKAVFKFFLYTVFGGLLMLAAILFIQFHMKSYLSLISWQDFYKNKMAIEYQYWLFAAFFIAFAIKSPIFPFHTWQADLYSQSDRPSLMIIAAVMSKMGIFGLIRFDFFFVEAIYKWQYFLIALCLVGVVYGALIAWRQKDMIRLLAYSSLSHMGLIAAGVLTMANLGVQGGLFAILSHGLAAAGLFFAADVIIRKTNDNSVDAVSGIAKVNPRFATYFFIILLSSIGLPLTCGFIGEFYLLWAITEFKPYYGAFGALTLIFGAVYMLRLYQKSMFGKVSSTASGFGKLSLSEDYVFIVIGILIIVIGFFPVNWIGIGQYAFRIMNFTPTN
ncbi:MAG: NADH-quinone oxidoreductase subunit M [Saprospiraceae bacterium]|nr:NADH-quinone oxidoreductase subunit M [Saprospiraceae bacterium]